MQELNKRDKDMIELIKSTPAMGILPYWPHKEEPHSNVQLALIEWIVNGYRIRAWSWFILGFGAGVLLIATLIILGTK